MKRKLYKDVKKLVCIHCEKEFPLSSKKIKIMNHQGWGLCNKCVKFYR